VSFKQSWTTHRRLRLLEQLAGATDTCQHGFAIQDTRSIEAFTADGREETPSEDDEKIICDLCGLPKQVIRIVSSEWPPDQV
jgi:hypothetical protein